MPAHVKIKARANSDWARAFVYRTKDGGPPIKLLVEATGELARLVLTVRRTEDSSEALILTSDAFGGIELTEAVFGQFQVRFTADQLARLGKGEFVLDLIAYYPDGRVETIFYGSLENNLGAGRT